VDWRLPGNLQNLLKETATAGQESSGPAAGEEARSMADTPGAAAGASAGSSRAAAAGGTSGNAVAAAAAAAAAGGSRSNAGAAGGSGGNAAAAAAFAGLFRARSAVGRSTGGTISKKTGQFTQRGAGRGLGGAGGTKTCKVCTVVQYRLTSVSEVSTAAALVSMANGHQASCPYCKCTGCRQQWELKANPDGTPRQITNWDFHKKDQCPHK
jgi:hypothetical protein